MLIDARDTAWLNLQVSDSKLAKERAAIESVKVGVGETEAFCRERPKCRELRSKQNFWHWKQS